MKVLIFNGSPRPKGNTKQMIPAYRRKSWMSFAGLGQV